TPYGNHDPSTTGAWSPRLHGVYMAEATASRLTLLEKALTVLTALLALGTGFLGYKSATISEARDQAQVEADSTSSFVSSMKRNPDALRAENARLRDELGLPAPSGEPAAPAASAAAVRHSGQLVLAYGRYADLDSPPSDPQWDDGTSDIYYG